jgi:serine/threonine kinase PknH
MQPLTGNDPPEIAGYRLRARLGAGGMGQVYLAFTPGGRAVAMKVMRPDLGNSAEFRNRFRLEVEAARRVHGLYTAQVLDADPTAVSPWLVTAFVPGPSLSQAVAEHGAMPPLTVVALMAGVAEALQAIHAAGIVHRDLKPSNVILAPDGPRVIDFGIARSVEAASLTSTGTRVGSPQYMAPEQVVGQAVSPALDVFALGSLAVYAVCGRPAFGEGDDSAVVYRILHQPADLGGVPANLRPLIEGCLAKDPASRLTPPQIVAYCRAHAEGTDEASQSWLPPVVIAAMGRHAAPTSVGQATPAPAADAYPPGPATPPPGHGYAPPSLPGRGRKRAVAGAIAAAVFIALIGVGTVVLLKSRSHHPVPSPTGPVSGSASAPPGASATGWLGGTWTGSMSQPVGVVPQWQANLTFSPDGAGTFRFGGLGCSGDLAWILRGQTRAEVDLEVVKDPRSLCVKFGLMTVTKSGSNTMGAVWRATDDPGNTAMGTLTRTGSGG